MNDTIALAIANEVCETSQAHNNALKGGNIKWADGYRETLNILACVLIAYANKPNQ